MAYCKKCGTEIREYRELCYDCEPRVEMRTKTFWGKVPFFILGLFFPVIGIPLAIIWWRDFDKSPKAILLGSLTSVFLWIAWFIFIVVLAIMVESGELDEYLPEPTAEQIEVYEDAVLLDSAAREYCEEFDCGSLKMIRYDELSPYMSDFNEELYDLEEYGGIVVYYTDGVYKINLERKGTGNYEFPFGQAVGLVTALDMEIDED